MIKYLKKIIGLKKSIKKDYCLENDIWNTPKCKKQCKNCKNYIKSYNL